jgi:hypothetical protein
MRRFLSLLVGASALAMLLTCTSFAGSSRERNCRARHVRRRRAAINEQAR